MDYSRIPKARDRARHERIDQVRALFGIAVEYDGAVLDPSKVVLHTAVPSDNTMALRLEVAQLRELIRQAVAKLPNAATFARCLHEVTERVAAEFGHQSGHPPLWRDVDERNQALLLAVAQEMLMVWPLEDYAEPDPPAAATGAASIDFFVSDH
jgi:hypothetical protein